ncbi:type II toxin-antitoxin system HicA family toxin [Helicobacter mehlei]|uniref:Addiction module toxin, HicA family n=1 Tax=Helicobacter mehlei TaxID=2316080 RepID=A0A553UMP6_9HELI|nr:type II toxin-antitoxin system HicA family toxin [Helicobacter mehlei]TSA81492.1 addiction module toxin, HicA family [Helicobacter mehlei]
MAELPPLSVKEADRLLLKNGFALAGAKGGHWIYKKGKIRQVFPFFAGKILHPKIVKEIMENTHK